jgi:hypothetical protein
MKCRVLTGHADCSKETQKDGYQSTGVNKSLGTITKTLVDVFTSLRNNLSLSKSLEHSPPSSFRISLLNSRSPRFMNLGHIQLPVEIEHPKTVACQHTNSISPNSERERTHVIIK